VQPSRDASRVQEAKAGGTPAPQKRGAPGLGTQLVYVVQTEHGQETLAPEAFAKKYGWKNDPSKATPKTD
jgi:hypothetical protein